MDTEVPTTTTQDHKWHNTYSAIFPLNYTSTLSSKQKNTFPLLLKHSTRWTISCNLKPAVNKSTPSSGTILASIIVMTSQDSNMQDALQMSVWSLTSKFTSLMLVILVAWQVAEAEQQPLVLTINLMIKLSTKESEVLEAL